MKQDSKQYIEDILQDTAPDIRDQIKASHRFKVPIKSKKISIFNRLPKRLVVSLSTIIVVFVAVIIGITQHSEPVIASTVTLDINPSIEITLDDDDNIINITAINDEGEEIINRDVLRPGLSLDRVIEFIVQKAYERGYIVEESSGDNVVLINVSSNNTVIQSRVQTRLNTLLQREIERYGSAPHIIHNTHNITSAEAEQFGQIAGRNHMSVARVVLMEHIIELDSNYTLDDLKPLSIRELYRMREELLGNQDPFRRMPHHNPRD